MLLVLEGRSAFYSKVTSVLQNPYKNAEDIVYDNYGPAKYRNRQLRAVYRKTRASLLHAGFGARRSNINQYLGCDWILSSAWDKAIWKIVHRALRTRRLENLQNFLSGLCLLQHIWKKPQLLRWFSNCFLKNHQHFPANLQQHTAISQNGAACTYTILVSMLLSTCLSGENKFGYLRRGCWVGLFMW